MIVSASCRTDIPAFYGKWFRNRLRAGYCMMRNPFTGISQRVSLARQDVDGFVFWTKNLGPFLPVLDEVAAAGHPFIVQYTITGYPRAIEAAVTPAERAVEHMHTIASRFGLRAAVWRYDPILLSSLTGADWHFGNFARLAAALEGTTDEVVTSFTQMYVKTTRNLNLAADRHGFTWHNPDQPAKQKILSQLAQIAREHGMQLALCTQPGLSVPGAKAAACVDTQRLSDVAGHPVRAATRGTRSGCLCAARVEIGEYDTCPHGCAYCYAVQNPALARERFGRHDPESEYLFPPAETGTESKEAAPAVSGPVAVGPAAMDDGCYSSQHGRP